jgi:hypothetical protein
VRRGTSDARSNAVAGEASRGVRGFLHWPPRLQAPAAGPADAWTSLGRGFPLAPTSRSRRAKILSPAAAPSPPGGPAPPYRAAAGGEAGAVCASVRRGPIATGGPRWWPPPLTPSPDQPHPTMRSAPPGSTSKRLSRYAVRAHADATHARHGQPRSPLLVTAHTHRTPDRSTRSSRVVSGLDDVPRATARRVFSPRPRRTRGSRGRSPLPPPPRSPSSTSCGACPERAPAGTARLPACPASRGARRPSHRRW